VKQRKPSPHLEGWAAQLLYFDSTLARGNVLSGWLRVAILGRIGVSWVMYVAMSLIKLLVKFQCAFIPLASSNTDYAAAEN
jgi:hypothetical protein